MQVIKIFVNVYAYKAKINVFPDGGPVRSEEIRS